MSQGFKKEVIGNAELYLGDCLDILPMLPLADSMITDPVWPNNALPEFARYDSAGLIGMAWKAMLTPTRAAFHLGCDSDPAVLSDIDLPFFRVCWLRYARPHYKGRLLYGADVAYLYGEPPKHRPGAAVVPGEVIKTESSGRTNTHPCERSIQHVKFLVEKWSEPDDLIVDPFMGSGTTGDACMGLGRKFIGIEIDPKYFDIACERLDQVQKQGKLFT